MLHKVSFLDENLNEVEFWYGDGSMGLFITHYRVDLTDTMLDLQENSVLDLRDVETLIQFLEGARRTIIHNMEVQNEEKR